MNIFFKWLKFDSRAKFCLIALSALGAHLFAVTSFKMLDYYVTEDWVCGNLTDLSIIAGSLMLVVCSSFAVRSLHAVRHASDIWVFLGFLAFVAFQWLALAVHHSIDHWHATPVRAFIMILVPLFLAGLNEAFTRFGSARVAVVKQVCVR